LRGLVLRDPRGARAGPRGERIPFRPSHATLLISHPDKNKRGIVAACFRPDEYGRHAIRIPDGCVICHCEVPIKPGAVLRRFVGGRLPRRIPAAVPIETERHLSFAGIEFGGASDRLSHQGGSAMLSVTDNSRGRAVILTHIVSFRQIARLTTKYSEACI
jgi:hypothetical protein